MMNGERVLDLIDRRYSCRSYDPRPIDDETQERLASFLAENDTGPMGTTVRTALIALSGPDDDALKGLGTYGFISGATGFIAGAVREEVAYNLEDFGYVIEQAVLFATSLGLGTVWLGGTLTKGRFADRLELGDDEILPAVIATGYEADQRRGLDALIRRGANANARLPWQELFFDGSFKDPIDQDGAAASASGGAFAEVLKAVRWAPSASNKQPWRLLRAHDVGHGDMWHLYMRRRRGYRARNALLGVADMQRIDMGIAMCHFALTAEELGMPGRWEVRPPADVPDPGGPVPADLTSYVVSWVPAEQT
jgi:nitroreductase